MTLNKQIHLSPKKKVLSLKSTSAVNRSVIWSRFVRMICGSNRPMSTINVAMVFAEALSACAVVKLVSQISLKNERFLLFLIKNSIEL